MNNTQLFDFSFVDRTNERVVFKEFFKNKVEKTLWINGDRGVGKTTFFSYLFNDWKDYALCYIDVRGTDTAADIMANFIMELQNHCKEDFLAMTKKKYKQFYNGIYQNIKGITSEIFPKVGSIVSVIMDVGYTAITVSDEKKSPINIITDYIQLILKEKKLCICIDNFSRCDIEVAQMFFQILKTFVNEDNFRSCILTTTEDLKEDLKTKIQETLPFDQIKINKLNEYVYFYQILNPIYDLSNMDNDDILHVFQKCDGSPQKLKTLISKLVENEAITMDVSSKAKIDKGVLFELLQAESIRFKEEDFSKEQQWVIFSYLCMPEIVDIQMLNDFAIYVTKKHFVFKAYNEDLFQSVLWGLLENKILGFAKDNFDEVTHCHDADYEDLKDMFKRSNFKNMFIKFAYEFLRERPDCTERQKLMCMHAREANMPGWKLENYNYGEALVRDKLFSDAQKVFKYLEDYLDEFSPEQLLTIALNSYETGNYQTAIKELGFINPEMLESNDARYRYYFYLGKSYNNIGKVAEGALMIEKALEEAETDSREYVETLNVLNMYYNEIIGKKKYCIEIFQYIRDRYKDMHPDVWAKAMRGCHNFLGDEEALVLLEEARNVTEDELEKAYIMTTMGFICMKLDDVEHAKELFEIACGNIKRLKIHEYSYAANNLALCYMLNKDYAKAKEILQEAYLWNRTDYGEIVIQNHLLICAYYLGQHNAVRDSFNFLYNYMETRKPTGSIINRKTYINLAIACEFAEHPEMKDMFFGRTEYFMRRTNTSEWRYYKLLGRENEYPRERPTARYELTTDFDPWFLVYAHD